MLSQRTANILNLIVGQYITGARPVPSHSLSQQFGLGVSPATIRNEMAALEQAGYITRPHTSAGTIPTDQGYRYYVENLKDVDLPLTEQRMVSHMLHQVEHDVNGLLQLTATAISQMVQNVAAVSPPKIARCHFKHLGLFSLEPNLGMLVVVLQGATVRQQLVNFEQRVSQEELTAAGNHLNSIYQGKNRRQIQDFQTPLTPLEKRASEQLLKIMETEDSRGYQNIFVDGLHYILGQPEFTDSHNLMTLTEMIENRNLLEILLPKMKRARGLQVIIGKEAKINNLKSCSMVLYRYGLPEAADGVICVVGPTRMPYSRAISTVAFAGQQLGKIINNLYGKPDEEA